MDETLESLRDQIDRIDRELVGLAAERIALARRIGRIKRARSLPVVDEARERAVLEQARATAAERGLDPRVAGELMAGLIRAAVRAQEEDRARPAAG